MSDAVTLRAESEEDLIDVENIDSTEKTTFVIAGNTSSM